VTNYKYNFMPFSSYEAAIVTEVVTWP